MTWRPLPAKVGGARVNDLLGLLLFTSSDPKGRTKPEHGEDHIDEVETIENDVKGRDVRRPHVHIGLHGGVRASTRRTGAVLHRFFAARARQGPKSSEAARLAFHRRSEPPYARSES